MRLVDLIGESVFRDQCEGPVQPEAQARMTGVMLNMRTSLPLAGPWATGSSM